MKKLLSLILVGAMSLGLVACAGEKKPAEQPKPSAEAQKEPEKKPEAQALKAAVFYYDFADTYISTVRNEMDKQLKEMGVEFQNFDAAGSQPSQTDSVKTAIASGYNLLIVNIVETASPEAAQTIVDAAKEAKIPLIFFNREVKDEIIKSYENSAFVGTDAPEAGHLQGEMIGEYVRDNFEKIDLNKDGKISYVMFKGQEGNNEAEARTQFAVEDANKILKAAGKPELEYYDSTATSKYLVDKDGKWSDTAANDYMSTILGNFSEANKNMVELVIANNDGMALGALSALENAGYNKDKATFIPIFGVDATSAAQKAITEDKMVGSVKQDNVGMATTINTLVKNLKEGRKIMDGTDKLNVDKGVAKIRVPYQKWTKQQ